MPQRRSAAAVATLIALCLTTPVSAEVNLSFGLYTSNKPTAMVKQFRPVLDLIEQRTSEILGAQVRIRIQVAKDYSQGIEHLASGKVDFSRFGPASYIEARRANAGLRILAMERVRGDKVFYGIIAVSKDSPITSVEELQGRSFAFGDDQSTIGRYLSQLYLRNHGILASDLSRFEYLGRHDTVGTAVGAGHFDAGALEEVTFSKLVAKGVPIRELARFPNVTKPWIARSGLPEPLFEALREALLAIDDPVLTTTLKADGFVHGEDSDYEEIRVAIEMNGAFFEPRTAGGEPTRISLQIGADAKKDDANMTTDSAWQVGNDGDTTTSPAAGVGWSTTDPDADTGKNGAATQQASPVSSEFPLPDSTIAPGEGNTPEDDDRRPRLGQVEPVTATP